MRSSGVGGLGVADDRTTSARIRDAAIDLVATEGVNALSARAVAKAAGVSPGSVIHHFGSMDGLRAACDERVAAIIRQQKASALSSGPGFDLIAALSNARTPTIVGYLAAVLSEDSPAVARLVDEMVADAMEYTEQGVQSGMLRPSENPHARAAILTVWGLASLVIHRHINRLLGLDLIEAYADPGAALLPYLRPVIEVFGSGIFTDEFVEALQHTLRASPAERGST